MKGEPVKEGRDDLAHRARELLAPFSHVRTFDSGELVFREGDDAGMLVAIEAGRVKVYRGPAERERGHALPLRPR